MNEHIDITGIIVAIRRQGELVNMIIDDPKNGMVQVNALTRELQTKPQLGDTIVVPSLELIPMPQYKAIGKVQIEAPFAGDPDEDEPNTDKITVVNGGTYYVNENTHVATPADTVMPTENEPSTNETDEDIEDLIYDLADVLECYPRKARPKALAHLAKQYSA